MNRASHPNWPPRGLAVFGVAALLGIQPWSAGLDAHGDWRNALAPTVTASTPSEAEHRSGRRSPRRPGPQLTLVSEGESDYTIVVPAQPTTQETKAAEELVHWLKEMNGVALPTVVEGESADIGKMISVGRTTRLAGAHVPERRSELGEEGYAIAVDGEDLLLFGGTRRGPLYAVFAFLEEDLGCRWYAAQRLRKQQDCMIPKRDELVVRPVLRAYVPPLALRDPYYWDAFDWDWSLRNRTNSGFRGARLPETWGGSTDYVDGFFVHTFERLVPVGEHVTTNPEYFAEWEGKRKPFKPNSWPGQLCLTNPAVLEISVDKVRKALRKAPHAEWISVSENDGRTGYCTCSACARLNEKEGATSAALVAFVNAVADAIREEFPRVRVTTLAYGHAYTPPKTIRPRDNVLIRFCTDQHAWRHPYRFLSESKDVADAMHGWAALGAKLTIWDYTVGFGNYLQPRPNLAVVAENIRTYVTNSAEGVMLQGAYQSAGASRAKLRCWVWSKLLWDPSLDVEALIRDFPFGYFGAAAEPLQAYNQLLWDSWERMHRDPMGSDDDPIGRPLVEAATQLIAAAEQLADSEELRRRVRREKLGVLHARLQLGPADRDDVDRYLGDVSRIETLLKEFGVTHMRERPRDVEERLLRWRAQAGQLRVSLDKPGTVFADDLGLRLAKHLGDYAAAVVQDPLAGNGYTIRQPGRRKDWSLQWVIPTDQLVEGKTYTLRLKQRLEKQGTEGSACVVGVYNPLAKAYPVRKSLVAADLPSDRYVWVTVGQFVPGKGDFVYVAPADNSEVVQGIYTDRIELQPVD
ncbi:MAG: DUF4838 domain-containing protein [Lentisphaerae bacterium]|nr:DUF4838 domain-containing protein [Lentisphaerota bacterium]